MKEEIQKAVSKSLEIINSNLDVSNYSIEISIPKKREFGDFSTNIALIISKDVGMDPRDVANSIILNLPEVVRDLFKKVEIAGPGFINFFVKEESIINKLSGIEYLGKNYGNSNIGNGERIIVEFVSANPTGYLHMGHARNACVGDAISNILAAVGYDVTREFFINDAGRQVFLLGHSVYKKYEEFFGINGEILEDGYHGEYIREIARQIKEEKGDKLLAEGFEQKESIDYCRDYAKNILLDEIKNDLNDIGVIFDNWYSEEREIYNISTDNEGDNLINKVKSKLNDIGATEIKDGALWFKASEFGDSQDWVIFRKDGSPTYLIADIGYHYDKINRGFRKLINVWGADHHGHVSRIKAALRALGLDDSSLQVVLIQFVRLMSNGQEISMSKRTGSYVTMREVLREVGRDVTRFFLLMRSSDSHLDFDLDLAKQESSENPVFYVQYAHARICSIFEKARERNLEPIEKYINLLRHPEEVEITKNLLQFPEVVRECAISLSPHKVAYYLTEIASSFHMYYNKHRIIVDDIALSGARLYFIGCIRTVLRNGLSLLGVSAPEKM